MQYLRDSGASVWVDNSSELLGGYFKHLSSAQDYFDVKVTSADGKQTDTERIYIKWSAGGTDLKNLEVISEARWKKSIRQ